MENDNVSKKGCPFCGQMMRETAKFCPSCGKTIDGDANNATNEAKENGQAEKEVKKTTVNQTLQSVVNFETTYLKAAQDEVKIKVIDTFVLPRDSAEMLLFMQLCAENISPASNTSYEVERAWVAKMDKAYQRARIIMNDDPLFDKIESIYIEKSREYRSKNSNWKKIKAWIIRYKGFVAAFVLGLLMVLIGVCVSLGSGSTGEKGQKEYNEKVKIIEREIENGEIEQAYLDVLDLKPKNANQREKKQTLLDDIVGPLSRFRTN